MTDIASQRTWGATWVLLTVMFCHFIAAFAALGMPPFFALILEESLHNDAVYVAGWFYITPALFAALSSPWWGKLSDRYGKKRLLIRAQLGLSASFLLAGFATNSWAFLCALMLQGILGGTFAASNAYLSTVLAGPGLTRGLTAMQWSARAALVAAPLCIGWGVGSISPIELYRYLALLPLLASLCIACLPNDVHDAIKSQSAPTAANVPATVSTHQIYGLQFAFVFATVVTFPYFISQLQQQFSWLSTNWAGLLFGLPHLVYLLFAMPLTRWMGKQHLLSTLVLAYGLLGTSLLGQAMCDELVWLVGWRLLMGLAMTMGYITLHALIARTIIRSSAGRSFGWLESSSKWGGVSAGLCSGALAATFSPQAPFVAGAIALASAISGLAWLNFNRLRWRSL